MVGDSTLHLEIGEPNPVTPGCRKGGGSRWDLDEIRSLIARRTRWVGMMVVDDPHDSWSAGSVAGYRFLPRAQLMTSSAALHEGVANFGSSQL